MGTVEQDLLRQELLNQRAERRENAIEEQTDILWECPTEDVYDLLAGNTRLQTALEQAVEEAATITVDSGDHEF